MASSSKGSSAQRRLIKKHNISFDNPIEYPFRPPAGWPTTRGILVNHVQKLGTAHYHEYQESISCDLLHRPWREQVRRRARRTATLSQRCLDERKNESGWRFSVEAEVVARMSVEVACRTCRGRLWRSEQEVDPGNNADEAAKRLRQRQKNRTPCLCGPNESQGDMDEMGINPLFDCLIDEAIVYPPELQSELPRREERPDRVYGLRATRKLESTLSCLDKRHAASGRCIGDSIRSHPFREDAEPVHFPFLLLEAKSEKGPDSLSDAAYQTAFSIRELLILQQGLQVAAGEGSEWDAGPLVWFLSYKGEEWKVCIAYIDKSNKDTRFRIAQVWRGAVNIKDNALRLLLIVDYILDWARDFYREAVIRSLRRLAVSDSKSLAYQDSDIFSTAERVRLWAAVDEHDGEMDETDPEPIVNDALRSFDTKQGVIRDIRYIHSRFLGLYITRDNMDAFFNSVNTQKESRQLACSLLAHLQEGWRVKSETLDALESDWTGKNRREDQTQQQATFLVVVAVAAYLTPDWQQTRELSYLAIEESAVDNLLRHAGQKLAEGHKLSDLPFVDRESFGDSLLACRRQPAKNNLLACISRICLCTGILSTGELDHRGALPVVSVEKSDQGVIFRADTVLKSDTTKRDFVRAIYDGHKIGRNEPFCPFLRGSSVLDELGLPEKQPAEHSEESAASPWFRKSPDIPWTADDKVLIATSSNPVTGSATPRLCLFVTDPASVRMSGLQIQELLQSEPSWYFRVKRYDNKRGWSNGWNTDPETSVTRDEPILQRLSIFAEALKTLEARTPHGPKHIDTGNEVAGSWAPKKPNTLWDVLHAPGLEFMSDAMVIDAPYAQLTQITTTHNPRRIRQVNREDTPRPISQSGVKGKEREVFDLTESDHTVKKESKATQFSEFTSKETSYTNQTPRQEPQAAKTTRPPPLCSDMCGPQMLLRDVPTGSTIPRDGSRLSQFAQSSRYESPELEILTRPPKRQRQDPHQTASSSSAVPLQIDRLSSPRDQLLSIPRDAEMNDLYLDDDTFAKLLEEGYFSAAR